MLVHPGSKDETKSTILEPNQTRAASDHHCGDGLFLVSFRFLSGRGAKAVVVQAPDTASAVHDNGKDVAVRGRGVVTATVGADHDVSEKDVGKLSL